MMKNVILTIAVSAILTTSILSQIFNTTLISIDTESLVFVDGDFTNTDKAIVNLHGELKMTGAWHSRNTELFDPFSIGKVTMIGGNTFLSGAEVIFPNLEVSKNGSLQLSNSIRITDRLILSQGAVDLNGHFLRLDNDEPDAIVTDNGHLFNPSDLGGIEQFPSDLETSYIYPFAAENGADASISMTFEILPSNTIRVNTYTTDVQNVPFPDGINDLLFNQEDIADASVDRFWLIETMDGVGNAELRFAQEEFEQNSIVLDNLSVLHFDGTEWVKADSLGFDESIDAYRMTLGLSGAFVLADLGISTAVDDLVAAKGNLSIAPNPTDGMSVISIINDEFNWDKVLIFNSLGHVLNYSEIQNQKQHNVDFSQLHNGIYFVRVVNSSTGKISVPIKVMVD